MLIDLDAPPAATIRRPKRVVKWKPFATALLLLLLGGAAAPSRGGVVQVASTGGQPADSSLLTDDALYALLRSPGGTGASEMRAYPLHPGGPSWAVRVTSARGRISLGPGGTIVVAPGEWGELTVLDARTGVQRWHAPMLSQAQVAGDRAAYVVDAERAGPDRLIGADLATGRTVWSADAEVAGTYAAAGYLITMDSGYRATVRAIADGRVLLRGVLGPDLWGDSRAFPIGDRIYLAGGSFVAAVRAADLRVLWQTPIQAPLDPHACGDAICVDGGSQERVTVLDPATGRIRWTDPRWRTIDADGYVTGDGVRAARVDLATGRVLRDLGSGVLAGDLVLRTDRSQTWVTRLGDGRVIGPLPFFTPSACHRHRPYLACPADGRPIAVWRIEEPK